MRKICFAMLLCATMILVVGCEKAKLASEQQENQEKQQVAGGETGGSVSVANIQITTASNKSVIIPVEIAATDEERSKGLMGRENVPFKNGGMWFVFAEEVSDPFWMKDTTMPLDIIFVGTNMKVVDIIANTTPKSEDKLISEAPYHYALEVVAGFAASNGVAVGDQVLLRIGPP